MKASGEERGARGESKSTYRLSRGVAFWGVLYPLALGLLAIIMFVMITLTAWADDRHCALIDASMASGTRETAAGDWPSFQETRLGLTLNAVGNPAGVFVHSHAMGGAGPDDFWRQWEEIQRRQTLPGSAPLRCIILGVTGAVVGDLYGTLNSLLDLARVMKAQGLRVILIGFPPIDRLGAQWLETIGVPGLAGQGYALSDYEAARGFYADQGRQIADAYVNPWRLLTPIADGLHPNWQSSYRAAITVVDAILYDRVYLP